MSVLGDALHNLRIMSPYPDLRAFSAQSGVSREGIRKVEQGKQVPSVKIMDKIISAVEVTKEEADRLRYQRNLAHALREGLLNKTVTEEKMTELANGMYEVFATYLDAFEPAIEFEEEDAGELREMLRQRIEEELNE